MVVLGYPIVQLSQEMSTGPLLDFELNFSLMSIYGSLSHLCDIYYIYISRDSLSPTHSAV